MPRIPLKNLDFIPSPFNTRYFKISLTDGRVYTPDYISSRLWTLCDGTRTCQEILNIVSKEFAIDVNQLENLLISLIEMGIIKEVEI